MTSEEARIAALEAHVVKLEERLNENTDLLMKFAQLSSGLIGAVTIAFENHSHDSGGYVYLSEETRLMYESIVPQMPPQERVDDHGGSAR